MAGSRVERGGARGWIAGRLGVRWATITVAALLAVTVVATLYTARVGDRQARERLAQDADETVTSIDRRMQAYGEVLLGIRGLFESQPGAMRFAAFVRSLQVEARYPGLKVVAYAPVVPQFGLAGFERAARRAAAPGDLYERYAVHPRPQGPRSVPIRHLEPLTGNEDALGLDLLSEPRRRDALERTQRTGQLSATAPLRLIQAPDEEPGFLYMIAVRSAGGPLSSVRTGRLAGVVSAAFDGRALFDQVLAGRSRSVDLEVYDVGPAGAAPGAPATRVYDSRGPRDAQRWDYGGDAVQRSLVVGGRRWSIRYRRAGAGASSSLPLAVGGLGALVSLLVGCVVALLGRGRAQAMALAARMTRDLHASHESLLRSHGELTTAEERVRSIIETAPEGFVSIDERGRITGWNPEAERIFGWAAADAIGRPLAASIVAPRERAALQAILSRVLTAGEMPAPHRRTELTGLRQDGSEVPLEVSISARHADGEWRFNAFIRDVTEQRALQAARREAEERFRRAFEDSGIGIGLVAVDGGRPGRLLDVNGALSDLAGVPGPGLTGRAFESLVHPGDVEQVVASFARLGDGEPEALYAEVRCQHVDGDTIWTGLTMSLVRDPAGTASYAVCQLQDISERKRFEGKLQHLADHDALTGLVNRRRFEEELRREVAVAHRYDTGGAVLALDLDNFKFVNDSLGHAAGDELIRTVAALLRSRLRDTDVLARLGGDEFAIILPRADGARAQAVARDVVALVRQRAIVATDRGSCRTSASIGIAVFDRAPDCVSAEQLMIEADIAMYDAKEAGRDRVAVFEPGGERHAALQSRVTWAEQIRTALRDDRFVLDAQPILPLLDGDQPHAAAGRRPPDRYELLLRMLLSNGDRVPPTMFLGVAERSSLIEDVDRWVIRRAAQLLAVHQREQPGVRYEVNLSGRTITDPGLAAYIDAELTAAGADPAGLIIEVTETAAIVNIDMARAFARELRALGAGFALDDFGPGFASLHHLEHLDFDVFKIDGDLIVDLPRNRTNQILVRSLVEIARALGKETIAECVADQQTFELLRDYGVDHAQGFHVGVPRPAEEIVSMPAVAAGRAGRVA